tara:strand:+ start:1937 stop:2743 length:807 start_codon:yes stop_codon:yes gene_type:complete
MRRELEILAQIDEFLDGEISKEVLMESFSDIEDLDSQIESQKLIRSAIEKEVFITQSQKALSKFKLLKTLSLIGIIIGCSVIFATTYFLYDKPNETSKLKSNQTDVSFSNEKDKLNVLKDDSTKLNPSVAVFPTQTERNPYNVKSSSNSKTRKAGLWKGTIMQNTTSFNFSLKLIKLDATHYTIISKITVGKEYAVMKSKGLFEHNILKFKEHTIIEESSISNEWCMKTCKLIKNGGRLTGDWKGKCAPGTIDLKRIEDDESLNKYYR